MCLFFRHRARRNITTKVSATHERDGAEKHAEQDFTCHSANNECRVGAGVIATTRQHEVEAELTDNGLECLDFPVSCFFFEAPVVEFYKVPICARR